MTNLEDREKRLVEPITKLTQKQRDLLEKAKLPAVLAGIATTGTCCFAAGIFYGSGNLQIGEGFLYLAVMSGSSTALMTVS